RVGEVPAAAERLVELHVGEEPVQARGRLGLLDGIELLLGVENLEIAGKSVQVPIERDANGLLERARRTDELRLRARELVERDKARGDLLERLDDAVRVLELRLIAHGERRPIVGEDAPTLEDRAGETASDGPDGGRTARDRRQFWIGFAHRAGEAQLG